MWKVIWSCILTLAAVPMTPLAVCAQQTNELPALFDAMSAEELTAANLNEATFLQDPTERRSRFVKVNSFLLAERITQTEAASVAAPIVRLNLFDGVNFSFVRESVDQDSENTIYVVGHSATDRRDRAVFVVENGQITGDVTMGGTLYQIRPVPGTDNVESIVEVNQDDFVDELEPDTPDIKNPEPEEDHSAFVDSDGPPVIDVMVVYTKLAAQISKNIENEIKLAVKVTNDSYKQSGVRQRINLVHKEQVDYQESGDFGKDRDRVQNPKDGFLDSVPALRNQHKADLVSLWVESPPRTKCGKAYIMEIVTKSFAPFGYSVVNHRCATRFYSFAHELGHNMGALHDRYVENTDNSLHTHNYGFVKSAKNWRTIMGYNRACRDQNVRCERLNLWSNPGVKWKGDPMGVALPASDAADNHLALNKTARTVASFR